MNHWSGALPSDELVVDDRVFVIGLDYLYRQAMKNFEAQTLLRCARKLTETLQLEPAEVPIEGYYGESEELTSYFRLMRALQEQTIEKEPRLRGMYEFDFLMKVLQSGLFGKPVRQDKLLPVGRDPLSMSLRRWANVDWNIPTLMGTAYDLVQESDDFSLVGVAVRIKDPVVVAAVRESVVLYAELASFGIEEEPSAQWQVDKELAEVANRFIQTFNQFSPNWLPAASAANAVAFARAFGKNDILGRCVRIGDSGSGMPPYYHWAIYSNNYRDANGLNVEDFWNPAVITTDTYRSYNPRRGPLKDKLPG